jgi:hypothetical protein
MPLGRRPVGTCPMGRPARAGQPGLALLGQRACSGADRGSASDGVEELVHRTSTLRRSAVTAEVLRPRPPRLDGAERQQVAALPPPYVALNARGRHDIRLTWRRPTKMAPGVPSLPSWLWAKQAKGWREGTRLNPRGGRSLPILGDRQRGDVQDTCRLTRSDRCCNPDQASTATVAMANSATCFAAALAASASRTAGPRGAEAATWL